MKALITTVPFAERDARPIELLTAAGIDFVINPIGRKLKEDELAGLIGDFDLLIAGTEPITDRVMARGRALKHISRIGIGLDSVDLAAAERRGITVSYTADAPAPAVAELTIGLMLSLLRHVQMSNLQMHQGRWHRYFGRRLHECTVGIVGTGRIGSRVLTHLTGFAPRRVLANDLVPNRSLASALDVEWVDKERIYEEADVISLHLPLTAETRGMIGRAELRRMRPDAVLINTARGGIIREDDLAAVLAEGHLAGVAIDVFEQEPYDGPLHNIDRCILTAHMGSMSVDCRTRMEIEATEEAIRFARGEALTGLVPREEYAAQERTR